MVLAAKKRDEISCLDFTFLPAVGCDFFLPPVCQSQKR
jgi:hypothetical protein